MFFTDDVKGDYERIKGRGGSSTDASDGCNRLDHCYVEGILRQPDSAYAAGALVGTIRSRKIRWAIADLHKQVRPAGRGCGRPGTKW